MLVRCLLFAGLVIHKLIWEIWKRKYPSAIKPAVEHPSIAKKIVKLGKIGFLAFLMIQALFLDILVIRNAPAFLTVAGLSLFILGFCISIMARIDLRQNWSDLEDENVLPQQVVTQGIYRYIRHPIYAGDVLLLIGFELALNSWLFVLGFAIAIVVVRQAIVEEKLLMRAFPDYADYCVRTKRFLPFLH